jgi:hypothetical protein
MADWTCAHIIFSLASKARVLIGILLQLGWSSNTCPPSWPMYPHSYMVDPPPKHVCEYKKMSNRPQKFKYLIIIESKAIQKLF